MGEKYQITEEGILFKVSSEIYDKDTVLRACYRFLDEYFIFISKEQKYYVITIAAKKEFLNTSEIEACIGEFNNELLHQEICNKVFQETKNIRELILTRAMYSSYIEEPEYFAEGKENYSVEEIVKDWFDE